MKSQLNEVKKLQKIAGILKEVGDATAKPYNFQLYTDDEYDRIYGFDTDSNTPYSLVIQQFDEDDEGGVLIDVKFYIPSDDNPDIEDYDAVTNKGELYRVMATVKDILQQEISNNPNINKISFTPEKRSKDTNINARLNLYTRYIKNFFPNAEFEEGEQGKIIVKIK